MEITSQRLGEFVDVTVNGRLDGYWADHLAKRLEEIMRQGTDQIRVNLFGVTYISSMGIRVLIQFYKKLHALQGTFVVTDPSEPVKKVLKMAQLSDLLMPATAPPTKAASVPQIARQFDGKSATFEIFVSGAPDAALKCRAVGDPGLLEGCRFREANCRTLLFPESTLAVGLGAFGHSFTDCHNRFGEFLAVAGAAAYQPTDGSNVPDFLLTEGTFVPELQVLYSIVCEGSFAQLARFEAKLDTGAVGLTELADVCLEVAGTKSAGIVMVAESAGLVGAALRQSPMLGGSDVLSFAHPQIRNWLSFTTERAHKRALAVVVGVAAQSSNDALASLLRPLSRGQATTGHFHAAAFSYRPLQRGHIDLRKTVRSLFEAETLLGLLHLLGDDRETVGVAESEFVRGACWIGPITEVTSERNGPV
jgi:anti-anti-sigma factor